MQQPEFPIKVVFEEGEETWIFNNEKELATSLEWFDNDDLDEHAVVTDNQGRAVRIRVEKLELIVFELE